MGFSVLKPGKFWTNQVKLITLTLMSFVFRSQVLRSRQTFDWDGRVTFLLKQLLQGFGLWKDRFPIAPTAVRMRA